MEKMTDNFDWGEDDPRSVYNWDVILDGNTNQLKRGEDFEVTVISFLRQARQVARKRDIGLKYKKLDEDTIVLTTYEREYEEGNKDVLYGDFLNYCLRNYDGLASSTGLAEIMGISWSRADKMIKFGQESGFIGEKLTSKKRARGFDVLAGELEKFTQVDAQIEPPKQLSVTRGQIANVKGGVYVN